MLLRAMQEMGVEIHCHGIGRRRLKVSLVCVEGLRGLNSGICWIWVCKAGAECSIGTGLPARFWSIERRLGFFVPIVVRNSSHFSPNADWHLRLKVGSHRTWTQVLYLFESGPVWGPELALGSISVSLPAQREVGGVSRIEVGRVFMLTMLQSHIKKVLNLRLGRGRRPQTLLSIRHHGKSQERANIHIPTARLGTCSANKCSLTMYTSRHPSAVRRRIPDL